MGTASASAAQAPQSVAAVEAVAAVSGFGQVASGFALAASGFVQAGHTNQIDLAVGPVASALAAVARIETAAEAAAFPHHLDILAGCLVDSQAARSVSYT